MPNEEEVNTNVKAFQQKYDDNNSGKDGIDDGEDDLRSQLKN